MRIRFFVEMYRSLIYVAITMLAIFQPPASAGTVTGVVKMYSIDSTAFYIQISGNVASKPVCNRASRFVVPINTDFGKGIMAQIISVKNSGATVTVAGQNSCRLITDSEDVQYISTNESVAPTNPMYFWTPVSNPDFDCSSYCRDNLGFAAAIDGNVCKAQNGQAYGYLSKGPQRCSGYTCITPNECGNGGTIAQCSCRRF